MTLKINYYWIIYYISSIYGYFMFYKEKWEAWHSLEFSLPSIENFMKNIYVKENYIIDLQRKC